MPAGRRSLAASAARGEGMEEEPTNEAMQRRWAMPLSPRCGARTRSGNPCRSAAVKGKQRCRMHGGAAGSGAQPGNRNALRYGGRSGEIVTLRRRMAELLREAREIVDELA